LPWILGISVLVILAVGTGALAAAFQDRGRFWGSPDAELADESAGLPRETVEEPTTPPSTEMSYEDQEDKLLEEFARDYDGVVRREDWEETYFMLDESSQAEFTEEEWAEAQQGSLDSNGLPAPLEGVTVDQNEEVTDVPARVTLYYEDGTQETIVAGVPMSVEDEGDAGEPKRFLSEEEIAELKKETTTLESEPLDEEQEVEDFVFEYYAAVEREDWAATYSMLADVSQEEFTEEEWIESQEIREDLDGGFSSLESAEVGMSEEFTTSVDLYFSDGTTGATTILYTPNNQEFGRLLTEEDIAYVEDLVERETSTFDGNYNEETAIEDTIRGHYEAIGSGDFYEAYAYFGSTFRSENSEDDWVAKEESYYITSSAINSVEVIEVSEDAATATVDVSFEDNTGNPQFRITWNLVQENGEWKLDEISSSEQIDPSEEEFDVIILEDTDGGLNGEI
jgi:hypothetical protein